MRWGPHTEEGWETPRTEQNVLRSLQKSLKLLSGLFALFFCFVLFCFCHELLCVIPTEDEAGPGDGLSHFLL